VAIRTIASRALKAWMDDDRRRVRAAVVGCSDTEAVGARVSER